MPLFVNGFAAGCATPDTLTFVVERRCDESPPLDGRAPRLLIVTNWTSAGFRPDILRAVMGEVDARHRFASQTAGVARAGRYDGLLLDFQQLGPRDVNAFVELVTEISDSATSASARPLGIVVPVADTASYPGRHLGALTDFLALRLELDPASPAPLTPRDRMAGLIGARAAEIGAHRVMLLLPADGYLWPQGEARVRISFEDAVATARDWGVELVRDESSATLRARAAGRGEIWVNDAGLIGGIVRDARRLGIRKFALYGLGGSDPAIWTAVATRPVTR